MTINLRLLQILVLSAPTISAAQARDTVRVGSVRLSPLKVGVDTFDVEFEAQSPTGVQRTTNVLVQNVTRERLGSNDALHVSFRSGSGPGGYWDVYVEPTTLRMLRYEQHTRTDSAIVDLRGECFTGWVDLEKLPRKTVACDRYTDRFGSAPIDDRIIALLPLRAGWSGVLATYGVIGGVPSGYEFTVAAEESVKVGARDIQTWRVERRVTSAYGTVVFTSWIDRAQHRPVKTTIDFGNGRKQLRTLRNP